MLELIVLDGFDVASQRFLVELRVVDEFSVCQPAGPASRLASLAAGLANLRVVDDFVCLNEASWTRRRLAAAASSMQLDFQSEAL